MMAERIIPTYVMPLRAPLSASDRLRSQWALGKIKDIVVVWPIALIRQMQLVNIKSTLNRPKPAGCINGCLWSRSHIKGKEGSPVLERAVSKSAGPSGGSTFTELS